MSGKGMAHLRHIQKQLNGLQRAHIENIHRFTSLVFFSFFISTKKNSLPKKKINQDKTDGLKKTNQKLALPGILGMPLIFFPSLRVHPQTSFQKKTTRPHLPFHVSMISQLSAHAVSGKLAEIGLANNKKHNFGRGWDQKPVINRGITPINDGLING